MRSRANSRQFPSPGIAKSMARAAEGGATAGSPVRARSSGRRQRGDAAGGGHGESTEVRSPRLADGRHPSFGDAFFDSEGNLKGVGRASPDEEGSSPEVKGDGASGRPPPR